MKKTHNTYNTTNRGFTLLFAILVATLVVSIGATIISLALRQTILSGTNRESNYAFYAANTVLECAVYWDIVGVGGTDPVFPAQEEIGTSDTNDITCAGINLETGDWSLEPQIPGWERIPGETTFYLRIKDQATLVDSEANPFNHTYCAQAKIIKTTNEVTGTVTTRIEARGYNTCDATHPRRVERGLIQEYKS